MEWFSVDKVGLSKLLERKGKQFVLYELVQNAWDENTSNVTVKVNRIPNSPYVTVYVSDDNPEGFVDLSHAFTLFAESNKKGDAAKRGRFNLGEKLVLALCRKAEIITTSGHIIFDEEGRRKGKQRTSRGSIFQGEMKMTDDEMDECRVAMALLIQPEHIKTHYAIGVEPKNGYTNGEDLPTRGFSMEFEEPLPTEIADAEGVMRRSTRKTRITIHRVPFGKQAWLYEMGIPVVEIDGPFHFNVHQKVPLNFDRDNVSPAYLARVHALSVEKMHATLNAEQANQAWVKVAVQENGDQLSNETVRKLVDLRFGDKCVAFDMSDPESNNIAASQGYQVIHGGALSKEEWSVFKRAGAILPAGQVCPSQPDSRIPRVVIPQDKWTHDMHSVARFCTKAAPHLIGVPVTVSISNNPTVSSIATYQKGTTGHVDFNMGRLGKAWFGGKPEKIITLVIHEFAHQMSGNHLSEEYYDALTEIGAKMTMLALDEREILEILPSVPCHFCVEEDESV